MEYLIDYRLDMDQSIIIIIISSRPYNMDQNMGLIKQNDIDRGFGEKVDARRGYGTTLVRVYVRLAAFAAPIRLYIISVCVTTNQLQ